LSALFFRRLPGSYSDGGVLPPVVEGEQGRDVPAEPDALALPPVVPDDDVWPLEGEGEPGVVAEALELPAVPVLLPDVLPAVPAVVLQGPPCGPVVLGVVVEG
jgi:hypothetical protein